MSAQAPTVTTSGNQEVIPGTASLSMTAQAPSVSATDNVWVTPGVASLTLAPQTPKALLTNVYTWEVLGAMPTTIDDLSNVFTATDFSEVFSDDNSYHDITGSGFLAVMARKRNSNSTDQFAINIKLKSSRAPTSSTVYMQLYNHNTDSWEAADSDNVTAADTELTLSVDKTTSLSDYYDADNYIAIRAYQEVA